MKKGFTLAEVLITLGIIGVIAALTTPSLVNNTGNAKIGPTLAKIVSTLENAHENMLKDEEATSLSKVYDTTEDYLESLVKYVSDSSYSTDKLSASSFTPTCKTWEGTASTVIWGNLMQFKFSDGIDLLIGKQTTSIYEAKGSFKGSFAIMYVDINGIKKAPNRFGKDIFLFHIDGGGQVIPMGSTNYAWLTDGSDYTSTTEKTACNEQKVIDGRGCAGSIFENNLKVVYD